MNTKLEKEVRFLKAYAIISTLLFGRLNVVEKDGRLRMVTHTLPDESKR